jgi:hypothetical protein
VMTCLTQIIYSTIRHLSIIGRCVDSRQIVSCTLRIVLDSALQNIGHSVVTIISHQGVVQNFCIRKVCGEAEGLLVFFLRMTHWSICFRNEKASITKYQLRTLCLRGPACNRRAYNSFPAAAFLHCALFCRFLDE